MVPAAISTWEEYYDYLLTRSHDNMPADSLTLLHIAQNNSGRLVEQARHSRPLTFGLSFSKGCRRTGVPKPGCNIRC